MVTGDSFEDEDGWRVHERYCIDHRAAFDMHEIVENIFMCATEFMHDSCLRMEEDQVGKQEAYGARLVVPRIGVFGFA
jgi:hypothetical protein